MNIPELATPAAIYALAELDEMQDFITEDLERFATAAIEAALPHLEAALRTQIAAEDNFGRPDAIDPDWREKIAIALQERKAARQQKGNTQ